MQETAAFTLFAILCLAVFGQCWSTTASPFPPSRAGVPVVLVTQDLEQHQLTIRGPAWGAGKPQVRLGTADLLVERYTANEIVARLPDDLKPALYLLTVGSDDEIRRHDTLLYAAGS